MDNPRPEKVAVVDEVRDQARLRRRRPAHRVPGANVSATAALRRSLQDVGGDYKIYKNTLVRFAARDLGLEIEELLTGPTAIAFVNGDPVLVAKALRDFARTNPALVVKGGLLGDQALNADAVRALADVEPREVLLARLAGALAAPMQQFAGLLQALPRNFAYGLKALIDQGGDRRSRAPNRPRRACRAPRRRRRRAPPRHAEPDARSARTVTDAAPPTAARTSRPTTRRRAQRVDAPPSPETPAADATDTTQES